MAKFSAQEAAEHWERLARAEEDKAKRVGVPGSFVDPVACHRRAATYRDTARALRLEAATGRPHCSICFEDHPNHQHPFFG